LIGAHYNKATKIHERAATNAMREEREARGAVVVRSEDEVLKVGYPFWMYWHISKLK
jgi:hypothetical protein